MRYCSKHHANPDEARFCKECGERLINQAASTKACPACHTENPNYAKFCHACGHSLAVNHRHTPPHGDNHLSLIIEGLKAKASLSDILIQLENNKIIDKKVLEEL